MKNVSLTGNKVAPAQTVRSLGTKKGQPVKVDHFKYGGGTGTPNQNPTGIV